MREEFVNHEPQASGLSYLYYNSQRFPITVNVHVKDSKQTHKKKAVLLNVTKIK